MQDTHHHDSCLIAVLCMCKLIAIATCTMPLTAAPMYSCLIPLHCTNEDTTW